MKTTPTTGRPASAETTRTLDAIAPPRAPARFGASPTDVSPGDLRAAADRADALRPKEPEREAPDPGVILASVRREDGNELRVSLHTFNGAEFLRIGLWQPTGWPVKGKSVAVRMRELATLARGVAAALDRVGGRRS